MTNVKLGEALRLLGIDQAAGQVYLALLELAPAPLSAIGTTAGLDGAELDTAYGVLVDAGLASAAGRGGDVVAPVPPAAGLEILARHRAAELEESRITVGGAFESFRRQRLAAYNDNLVEVVTGDAIGPRIRHAWASARDQIRQFESPPYFPLSGATDDALATLARGVTQRVVYSRESLEHPGHLKEAIEPCIKAGEQARVVPSVPVKLVIIDEAYALVSLSIKEADVHNSMLVVQPCGLLSALVALFEQSWQSALPFHGRTTRPGGVPPADRRVLWLLAGGASDDVIAREMGISRRTLFRRLQILMAQLGAENRFQLALQAQRCGWL
ncbi:MULTISPECIES: LuxR family transcriptional regulator [unclassified Streptomyces]|uniref:LuxR family transcriptional regulator n=1 Tax=unclassified Streptomyces TaxID=2593676 RepID=UPI002259EF9B|nr:MULTISPECIES: LuxR family transcriptional regulator [unclassified Streptomyces]WSP53619.1 LuxR family transcriptional regulator [Streptomyces sp. NBC_01241]WSU25714.1 LuxR family transcriptional regulator [Streptomyces sp. NBC_01108]MCX4785011.1 LuxR family transcriptional regulator [Streptomyces sp. NBC_01221]MCX4799052.1 LuxR family transcriptional regulator [Streptomyces sp. NBC_01242]WSJ40240.1 LuxR family transcriptional regulator [Streptomyces sp. NBC_01321]